ncbi:MAG: hypothetical protein P1P65_01570 [Treponema sp.]
MDSPDSNSTTNNNHPTAKDIYEYLWRGRDFELARLWERSVFLAAFLIAVAGAYAVYIKDVFIPQLGGNHLTASVTPVKDDTAGCKAFTVIITEKSKTPDTEKSFAQFFTMGIVPLVICFLGALFSVLWILMGKGSKAWYELYESNIARMSNNRTFWEGRNGTEESDINKIFCNKKTGRYTEYLFGNLHNCHGDPMNTRLLSPVAGPFFVSKINIMIGIISLQFFILAFFFHLYRFCTIIFSAAWHPLMFLILPAAALCFFVFLGHLKKKLGSSYLENE